MAVSRFALQRFPSYGRALLSGHPALSPAHHHRDGRRIERGNKSERLSYISSRALLAAAFAAAARGHWAIGNHVLTSARCPALRMRKWPIPRTGKTGRTDAGPLHDDRPSPLASAARKATLIPRAETAPVEFRGVVPFGWCRLAFAKARARLKKRRSAGLSLPGHQIALN